MKKIVIFLIVFLIFPFKVMGVSASNCVVMDLNSGRVLYNIKGDESRLIASITKIMTTLITIMYADLDKLVVVDEDILKAYGSSVYLSVGEEIKLEDLLYGLMLRSGNDAAIAVAKSVAGSVDSFVYLMNEYAKSIGMKNTHFINPHGLDNNGVGNKSSAYDMALLTKVAMQNEKFRTIFGTREYQAKSNLNNYVWTGKNKLFKMYQYTTGGKTGYTKAAHKTLVTTASRDNKDLVVVTLNDGNDFNDHKALYERFFKEYESILVIDKNNFKIDDNYYKNSSYYVKDDYYALVTSNEKKDLKLDINIYKYDNIYDGMKIGEMKVMVKDTLLHMESIYLKKENKEIKKDKKSLWQKIVGWFKKW